MLSVVKKLLLFLIFLTVVVACCLGTLVYFSVQSKPIVGQQNPISTETAKKAKSLSKKLLHAAETGNKGAALRIDKDELQGMTDMARRAFSGFQAEVVLSSRSARAVMSVPAGKFMPNNYLNAMITLLPSERGLVLDTVYIGDLSIKGQYFIDIAEWIANVIMEDDTGSQLVNAIKAVRVSPDNLEVQFRLPEDFGLKEPNSDKLALIRDKLLGIANKAVIAQYLEVLHSYQPLATRVSLVEYINVAFRHARNRTLAEDVEVVKENQAAILALATYFGSHQLRLVLGSADIAGTVGLEKPVRATLSGRLDLQQHFIYSAAIEVLSNQGISDLIGELKELLDSTDGGSGFSFADLQADKAGVRFAKLATANDLTALKVQKLLSQISSEREVFPSIIDLPEGIHAQEFAQHYINVESKKYRAMVAEIDLRLDQIPLYSL